MNRRSIPDELITAVCTTMDIPPDSLLRRSRLREIVYARHLVTIVLIDDHKWLHREVAKVLNRKRSTVTENLEEARDLLDTDDSFRRWYDALRVVQIS
jgi:chromosomal replication initiation ATPase DnaA